MLSIEEAIARLVASAVPIQEAERLPLADAHLRILAQECAAAVDVPPAANSAMDGYACHVQSPSPPGLRLPVTQTITAGMAPQPLAPGSAARIFTGAEIPAGANCVIMQEDCESTEAGIRTLTAVSEGQNIRPQGQDVQRGSVIARPGDQLSAALLGVLASAGISDVWVKRKLRVALLNTGSELVAPGNSLQPGQIYNSNQFALQALLKQLQCDVEIRQAVADRRDDTEKALIQAAQNADLVISSGGVSVGDEDHVKQAMAAVGEIDFYKICMKPGKPLAFGRINIEDRAVPVLGLPGNPVSAYVTFLVFGKPFIEALLGRGYLAPNPIHLPAAFSVAQSRTRPEFLRVRVEQSRLHGFGNQSSGVLSSLAWAEGLALLPAGGPIAENTALAYYPMAELASLQRRL